MMSSEMSNQIGQKLFFGGGDKVLHITFRTSKAGRATWTLQVKLEKGIFGHKETTVCHIDAQVSQLETS